MNNVIAPVALRDAPMEYAPVNELGVVFLFSRIARRLKFRIVKIQPQFPDCLAHRLIGDGERPCRIEFEFRSSNFRTHGHDPEGCDAIVCWHHDWPDAPVEVIELKRFFGVSKKVWIQQAIRSQHDNLDRYARMEWSISKRTTPGDLLLMYRCHPVCAITDVFTFSGTEIMRGSAAWRDSQCFSGQIRRLCKLASPIFLKDLQRHKAIQTASFVRRNMQGVGLQATEYWPYLYQMIVDRNPAATKDLRRYRPEHL